VRSRALPQTPKDKALAFLEERTSLSVVFKALFQHDVPGFVNPLDYLGEATAFVFINQAITGILLAMFYNASTTPVGNATAAYHSIVVIMTQVPLGWVLRGLHYWGANAMVVLVFCHMLRVFYVGAYRKPRELTWIFGVLLLGVVILFAFTGYLLPWDQQAYWATMVGTDMPAYLPFIGQWLLELARGGQWLSGATLTRFYAIHMLILPLTLVGLLSAHVALVFKHGQSTAVEAEERGRHDPKFKKTLVNFWPNAIAQMSVVMLVVALGLVTLTLLFKAPLLGPAQPLNPSHYKPIPAWYFYGIYYVIDIVGRTWPSVTPILSPIVIIGLPLIGLTALVLVPWIDHAPSASPAARPMLVMGGLVGVAALVTLTYLGNGLATGGVANVVIAKPTFSGNIEPIFQAQCTLCHNPTNPTAGLDLTSYQGASKLGIWVPGKPQDSLLYEKLTGAIPPQMPLDSTPLPPGAIQTIANWIKEGAPDN
jgi:ubiquinol-cytochrome c reductase cytochrome b subunit